MATTVPNIFNIKINIMLFNTIRVGSSTILAIDDTDGDRYNASMNFNESRKLEIHRQEGVQIGTTVDYDDKNEPNQHIKVIEGEYKIYFVLFCILLFFILL